MRLRRRYITVVLAAAVPVGLLATLTVPSGTAWAKTGTGTVSCSSLGATVTFKPPLIPAGTAKEKSTIKPITMGSCTANGTAVAVSKVTATIKVVGTNSCAGFAANVGQDSLSLVVKWSGLAATKVTFPAGTLGVNSTNTGFVATGGKATGSFKTTSGSFSANIQTSDTSKLAGCISGTGSVSSLQITSGSATF